MYLLYPFYHICIDNHFIFVNRRHGFTESIERRRNRRQSAHEWTSLKRRKSMAILAKFESTENISNQKQRKSGRWTSFVVVASEFKRKWSGFDSETEKRNDHFACFGNIWGLRVFLPSAALERRFSIPFRSIPKPGTSFGPFLISFDSDTAYIKIRTSFSD